MKIIGTTTDGYIVTITDDECSYLIGLCKKSDRTFPVPTVGDEMILERSHDWRMKWRTNEKGERLHARLNAAQMAEITYKDKE
jgi:hypothetical protein